MNHTVTAPGTVVTVTVNELRNLRIVIVNESEIENPLTPRRLVTVKEACVYGKMGHSKLYEYMAARRIKAYKREKTTLVDLNSIDALNESLPAFVTRSEQS